jgi:DNA invertase Pin-like site-specific DNA recombinase
MDELKRPIRCAIYTRKSTEEGLEQSFNSLDAQREAAVAYIQSQRHLGWTLVNTRFDDGGFSGGNLDRPALQQLLEQIEAKNVDCVVVYKVDRLSRSLLDFARLMDRFDQRSVSFVSVTQQFNTTTSLGRLTLNVLLSFAQFEREIISERTRDKMAAARKKGKWVGGTPMLGYDVDPAGGRLVINSTEAACVREIFDLYRRRHSFIAVIAELEKRGWTTKSWQSRRGVHYPGRGFTKVSLRSLLTNPTYCGKVRYRNEIYSGEHSAIIEPTLWDEVNADLVKVQSSPQRSYAPQDAPLAGLLFCVSCEQPMIASYSTKSKRRYRYYVCQTAQDKGWKNCPTKSVAAELLESSLALQLPTHIRKTSEQAAAQDGITLNSIRSLVEQIRYDGPNGLITVKLLGIANPSVPEAEIVFEYSLPRRRGRSLPAFRLRPARETLSRPPRLARLLALAHRLEDQVQSGRVKGFVELARLTQVTPARIAQILILSQLAPSIQEHILSTTGEHEICFAEHELRTIAREPIWERQQIKFELLLARHTA